MNGQPITQFAGMSAFAEQQLVSSSALVHVPDDVPMEAAALVGCSVMTGVGAATNTARVQAGQTVAVVGCGGVGLNVIQGAVAAGASRVIAVDMLENKLAAAKEFGATDVVDASTGDPVAAVKELVRGGVDYAFEAIGLVKTAEQCFEMAKRGGRAVIVGMLPFDSHVTLPGAALPLREGHDRQLLRLHPPDLRHGLAHGALPPGTPQDRTSSSPAATPPSRSTRPTKPSRTGGQPQRPHLRQLNEKSAALRGG